MRTHCTYLHTGILTEAMGLKSRDGENPLTAPASRAVTNTAPEDGAVAPARTLMLPLASAAWGSTAATGSIAVLHPAPVHRISAQIRPRAARRLDCCGVFPCRAVAMTTKLAARSGAPRARVCNVPENALILGTAIDAVGKHTPPPGDSKSSAAVRSARLRLAILSLPLHISRNAMHPCRRRRSTFKERRARCVKPCKALFSSRETLLRKRIRSIGSRERRSARRGPGRSGGSAGVRPSPPSTCV